LGFGEVVKMIIVGIYRYRQPQWWFSDDSDISFICLGYDDKNKIIKIKLFDKDDYIERLGYEYKK
jgi:hypothetical protein